MTLVNIDNTAALPGIVEGIQLKGFDNRGPRYFATNFNSWAEEEKSELALWALKNCFADATVASLGIAITELEWLAGLIENSVNMAGIISSISQEDFIETCGIRVAVDFTPIGSSNTIRIVSSNFHSPTIDDI